MGRNTLALFIKIQLNQLAETSRTTTFNRASLRMAGAGPLRPCVSSGRHRPIPFPDGEGLFLVHRDVRVDGKTAGIVRGYYVVSDGIVIELFQQPFDFLLCGITSNLFHIINGRLQISVPERGERPRMEGREMAKTNLIGFLRGHGQARKMFFLPSFVDGRKRDFRLHGVGFIDGKEMAQTFHIGRKVP